MSINFKKNILLTGAGFTANFGGPLAREMWSKILNNPKIESLPEIKKILLSNFDFEEAYSEVSRSGRYTDTDKEIFQQVMIEAYSDMDETLKSYVHGGFNQYGCYWGSVSSFLALFNGNSGEVGAHFTLNQDILLERSRSGPVPLGITATKYREYWDALFAGQIATNQRITLYTQPELDDYKSKLNPHDAFHYIKLHGSHGWLSSTGKAQMIIGKNKVEDIQREPILSWYFELFKEALNKKDTKLFVIGYSFRDQHVNDCIISAIENFGLKLYVISPEDPERLRDRLEGKIPNGSYSVDDHNMKIWNAIHGYFPYKLADIFPKDQTVTQVSKDLKKLLQN